MFFYFARTLLLIAFKLLYRVKIAGEERVPKDGSFIICANHIHWLDVIMITICVRRRLYFIAKKEIFENKFNGFFLRKLGAFPVDRGKADMSSFKYAINILKEGKGLLVFSQGHRMKEFENSKSGTALFALKSGAPVVPVGIVSEYKLFSRVQINVGEPIPMEKYKDMKIKSGLVEEVMQTVVEKVRELTK